MGKKKRRETGCSIAVKAKADNNCDRILIAYQVIHKLLRLDLIKELLQSHNLIMKLGILFNLMTEFPSDNLAD